MQNAAVNISNINLNRHDITDANTIPKRNTQFVYFVGSGDCIRIGYSEDIEKRLADHAKYGFALLALLPASERCEKKLHEWFEKYRKNDRGGDRSTYDRDAVFPYVERLLQYQYASDILYESYQWSRPDFRIWGPKRLMSPLWEENQGTLFITEGMIADERDCYETPEYILDACRAALGGTIDTDPCSTAIANRRIGALSFYTERQNGLTKPWFGRVFLNPPYSGGKEAGAAIFTRKLIDEMRRGNVTEAITVLNLQSMPTLWFPAVWENASAHAVWKRRIDFIRPRTATGSKPFASSKNGTIFSYFGGNAQQFSKAFYNHAMVMKTDEKLPQDESDWDCMWSRPFDYPERI
jgi:hypothetical protein